MNKILGANNWVFSVDDLRSDDPSLIEHNEDFWSEKAHSGKWKVLNSKNGSEIASFQLLTMANCCGICVSTRANVNEAFRKMGLGTLLNELRKDIAKNDGYGILFCTSRLDNEAQQKILTNNGWKKIFMFNNPRTKNNITLDIYDLSQHKI